MIALAADVGEGADDGALLPLLDAANVCCGEHAGSVEITAATAGRCAQLGIAVGAHPGYADRANFGRVEAGLGAGEIEALIDRQVQLLRRFATVVFVKPHGALYHRCQQDPAAADAAVRVARRHGAGIVAQPEFALYAAAISAGVTAWREGYADRTYQADGSLVSRGEPGAVLGPEGASRQAVELARSGRFDVICFHGDTVGATEAAVAIRAALMREAIGTGPLGST